MSLFYRCTGLPRPKALLPLQLRPAPDLQRFIARVRIMLPERPNTNLHGHRRSGYHEKSRALQSQSYRTKFWKELGGTRGIYQCLAGENGYKSWAA